MTIPKIIALTLLPAYVVAIAIFFSLDITTAFESVALLLILNTVFIGLIPIFIAYLSAKLYNRSNEKAFLIMGCGMLTLGLSSILASALISLSDGPNVLVTIHNSGFFIGSVCQTIAGVLFLATRTSWLIHPKTSRSAIIVYTGVVCFTLLLSLAAALGYMPRFFVQGTGPTAFRQFILISAINFFVVSSVLFAVRYAKIRSDFLYWYSISLGIIGIGLLGVLLQESVGSPIGWLGRSAQYIGGFFGLVALFKAGRSGFSRNWSMEETVAFLLSDVETSYENLVEMAGDGIIDFDQAGRVVSWNSAAESIFGWSKLEALGSDFFALILPDNYSNVLKSSIGELRELSQAANASRIIEMEASRKDGANLPVEMSISLRGTPGGWLCSCIIRDRIEQRRTEEELRDREERFRTVADFTYDWEYWVGPDGSLRYVSPSCERITGYHKDEFLDNPGLISNIVHPEDRSLVDHHLNMEATAGPCMLDFRILTRNGQERWIGHMCQPVFTGSGERLGRRVSNRDITRRKLSENRLRESEQRYRLLFEGSPVGLIHYGVDGVVTACNTVVESIMGAAKDRVIGLNLINSLENQEVIDVVKASLSGKRGHYDGWYTSVIGGQTRWVNQEYAPLSGPDGLVKGGIGILQDITERKLVEEDLRIAHNRLYTILSNLYGGILLVNSDGVVEFANQAFCDMFTLADPPTQLVGMNSPQVIARIRSAYANPDETVDFIKKAVVDNLPLKSIEIGITGGRTWLLDFIPIVFEGKSYGRIWHHTDITLRKLVEEERERMIIELKDALSNVKKLSGLLPICASCKKIRDDAGYWNEVEQYVRAHSEAEFSHSICPDCMRKLYPDIAEKVISRIEQTEKK